MKTAEFDYYLPPELIAQSPVEPRDSSRLMVLHRATGFIEHRIFREIVDYINPGDVLVANQSRVIPARLYGYKLPTGGKIELLLVSRRGERLWEALVKGRKIKEGTKLWVGKEGKGVTGIVVGITEAGSRLIEFETPIEPVIREIGSIPLPPYIHQPISDPERYQTIFARVEGSVAAPTAGLHFTPELMRRIEEKGGRFVFVTLHIGLDTFRPVKEENVEEHKMHSEYCELSEEVAEEINQARREGRRIIAVGTTSVRVLETAASEEGVRPFRGQTDLFIYPGYRFKVVDALITNFHLPRSTLIMLVSAFAGKDFIMRAYQEAVRLRYRFYSFGDAMLIL
ncbi:MAG: tRNA preQ1(34) S-adenosylmethionine ribosyltransferase-isomerase QueA [Anaerolineae bacterium]|nr:tRNA preQ1(34) S-adenosylmethionine ribosyltransferase-isomerase QueA [Anaerolineae bacterium]MDW8101346.1 tRNA preQ1(34) S-adenosylmethionine ribosyltransferase-isomerase QueA [Anaerolineae bacterium]